MGKYLFRFFISAAVILLIFVLALFILSSLLISKDSVLVLRKSINYTALASANKKLQKELLYITQLENKIKADKPNASSSEESAQLIDANQTRKIEFTSEELNAVLVMSVTGTQTLNPDANVFSTLLLGFKKGKFNFNGSKRIPFMTPFGRYINIHSRFTVNIVNNNLKLNVQSFRAGDIPFPKFIINYFMSREQAHINNIPLIQELIYSVKELEVFKDKVIIVYYPVRLLKVMSSLIYPV